MKKLPKEFCWTRMGTEAGESLQNILHRKELERKLNSGVFTWGIGSALGEKVRQLVDREKQPTVFFSKMKSKARPQDAQPKSTVLWTSYITMEGQIKTLPEFSFLTSGENGTRKKHYALICQKAGSIKEEKIEPIDFNQVKNLGSENDKLGFSQVTAIVEKKKGANVAAKLYDIMFAAELANPYYVVLANPVPLNESILSEYRNIWSKSSVNQDEWKSWVKDIREWAESQVSKQMYMFA